MDRRLALLVAGLAAAQAVGKDKPTVAYRPLATDEEDRPVATAIFAGTQGSNYALRVDFDKTPWGEDCKSRCANATVLLDTDGSRSTGLQLAQKGAPETGADLAVTIQGARDYREGSADVRLRVKVRQLGDDARTVEDGSTLQELDHRNDAERLVVEGKSVFVLVDATSGTLPSGPAMRVVYHPPGAKPVVGSTKGMLAPGAGQSKIFKERRR
ncbi:MAG: hypothetical protein HYZ28_23970 [Myxococcales bacterium]|nr:hypothetical protein [Myxococcales bacterium]